MNNHVCYANWFPSAGLLRIMFHNYNSYLLMGKSAFLPPSPLERSLQLLLETVGLAGLMGSAFVSLWSEFAGLGLGGSRYVQPMSGDEAPFRLLCAKVSRTWSLGVS